MESNLLVLIIKCSLGMVVILLGIEVHRRQRGFRLMKKQAKRTLLNGKPVQSVFVRIFHQLKAGRDSDLLISYGGITLLGIGFMWVFFAVLEYLLACNPDKISEFILNIGILFLFAELFISYYFKLSMGDANRRKIIDSYVVSHVSEDNFMFFKLYRPVVKYAINGTEKIYVVPADYSKGSVPPIGSKIELLYSYDYNKIQARMEYKKNSIFLVGLCIVIIFWTVFSFAKIFMI